MVNKQPPKKPTSRDASRRQHKTREQKAADEKKAVKENLRSLIEAEVAKQEKFRYLRREDIRIVMGVGNLDDYENELESNFAASKQLTPAEEKAQQKPKPKLKIVSKRKKRKK